MPEIEFITDREIYEKVIIGIIPQASEFLWLATSDLKDLHVSKGEHIVPFLETLSDLAARKVAIRLMHAKEPGPVFRQDFDKYPGLLDGMERVLCPRVHFKSVVVDGRIAYTGSANLTGAGMGAKSNKRRNFEAGLITSDPVIVGKIMDQFDGVWMGSHCEKCGRKEHCPEILQQTADYV